MSPDYRLDQDDDLTLVSQLLVGGEGHHHQVESPHHHLLGELELRELLVEPELPPGLVHHQAPPPQLSLALLLWRLEGQTVHQAVRGLREQEDDGHLLLLLLLLGGQAGAAPTEDRGLAVGV